MSDLEGDVNVESDCDPVGPVGINYNAVPGVNPLLRRANVISPQASPPPTTEPLGILQQFSMPETTGPPTKHTPASAPTLPAPASSLLTVTQSTPLAPGVSERKFVYILHGLR